MINKQIRIFICVLSVFALTFALIILGADRSPKWEGVRKAHLVFDSSCNWCGQDDIKKLEVHHVVPFHDDESLELEQSNLITFCRFCHFVVGHNCNWSNDNLNCRKESKVHKLFREANEEKNKN